MTDADQAHVFERLVRPHFDRLYRLAWRLTGARPEAEDLFQELLIKSCGMLDQLVRTRTGGEMLRQWTLEQVPAEDYIVSRMGGQYTTTREAILEYRRAHGCPPPWASPPGDEATEPDAEVAFRRTGEVHKWMYDRFSLTRLLQSAGFESVTVMPPRPTS